MQEERNFSRVDFRVKALLQGDGVALKGEVKDLSLHGVFLETAESVPVGTAVKLTFYLSPSPDPIVINVDGNVVRSPGHGIACSFDTMDHDSFAHLRSIIAYQGGDQEKVLSEYVEYVVKQEANA